MKDFRKQAIILCALFAGCSGRVHQQQPAMTNTADIVVVEFLIPIPSLLVEATDRTQVSKTIAWLDEVRPTQLPPHKLGAVMPWCHITFLTLQSNGAKKPITTNSIYSVRDRTTGTELVGFQQRKKLLDVFNLEEVPNEPYIAQRKPKE